MSFTARYPSALLWGILSVPAMQMGQQAGHGVSGWGAHKARAATGCLTRSCSSTMGGWGTQPPVSSSTLSGLGEALICPQGLWRHKGGTAARNPSMCHVRSKLRFSLRAWLSLPSGGVRKGNWGWCPGAAEAPSSPQELGGEHSAHYRVSLQGSQGPPCGTQSTLPPHLPQPRPGRGGKSLRLLGLLTLCCPYPRPGLEVALGPGERNSGPTRGRGSSPLPLSSPRPGVPQAPEKAALFPS